MRIQNRNQAVSAAGPCRVGQKAGKIAKQLTARGIVVIFLEIGNWDGNLEFKPYLFINLCFAMSIILYTA